MLMSLAIDGKQPTLTGSSNITTGTISASNVTASGTEHRRLFRCQAGDRWKQPTLTGSSNITTGTINASNVTASGILNIAGYTDVKAAIDGKQPTLTGSAISRQEQSMQRT
jgi:hypothetical protein